MLSSRKLSSRIKVKAFKICSSLLLRITNDFQHIHLEFPICHQFFSNSHFRGTQFQVTHIDHSSYHFFIYVHFVFMRINKFLFPTIIPLNFFHLPFIVFRIKRTNKSRFHSHLVFNIYKEVTPVFFILFFTL